MQPERRRVSAAATGDTGIRWLSSGLWSRVALPLPAPAALLTRLHVLKAIKPELVSPNDPTLALPASECPSLPGPALHVSQILGGLSSSSLSAAALG